MSEQRLIDANALLKFMNDELNNYETLGIIDSFYLYEIIEERIKNAPTVDSAPVVHGHWISCFNAVECSVCKRFPSESKRYCPSCGAKMDEEVNH